MIDFEFFAIFETFALNSFVSVCLVASTTTRAEKLPEGLEEQVESTIIDPIARLRESPTPHSDIESEPDSQRR